MSSSTDRPIRWGILATGRIAESFAADLQMVSGHTLAAVGSRRIEAAQEFADTYGTGDGSPRAHGSYEDLAADPDVDVIYVATPHSRHLQDVRTCFAAGKAVLCEKAVTMNTADTTALVEEARERGLFFAEAMWMRTNPAIREIRRRVQAGELGTIGQVRADLGFTATPDKERLWDPELGASAVLDIGIYPLTFAHLMLGEPESIRAAGTLSDRGIDVAGGVTLTYPGGATASLSWSQMAQTDCRASVAGKTGLIEIPPRFHHPDGFALTLGKDEPRSIEAPTVGKGYSHEIEEVGACLRTGRTESDLLPLDETISLTRQMDEVLSQIGVAPR